MKGIVIKPGNNIRVQEFGEPLYQTIGALWDGYIEIVRLKTLEPYVLIVDEEGLLKPNAKNNVIASILNDGWIAGTAVVMKEGFTEDGEPDIFGLDETDVDKVDSVIRMRTMGFAFVEKD